MGLESIVVIGTSAGGMEALTSLVEQLPTPFAAPLLVVQHQAPENSGEALRSALSRSGKWLCAEATVRRRSSRATSMSRRLTIT